MLPGPIVLNSMLPGTIVMETLIGVETEYVGVSSLPFSLRLVDWPRSSEVQKLYNACNESSAIWEEEG
jgi:hypothetical protein